MLAIAAQIPSSEIGTRYFQETHPEQLFRECSHYCELVSHPSQMPRTAQLAMQYAISRQGVSVIALPGDVAASPMPSDGFRSAELCAQNHASSCPILHGWISSLLSSLGKAEAMKKRTANQSSGIVIAVRPATLPNGADCRTIARSDRRKQVI